MRQGRQQHVEIGQSRLRDYLVLRPTGRLDNGTSAEFQLRLIEVLTTVESDVILDFAGVEYISSAGLRALMIASKQKPPERIQVD